MSHTLKKQKKGNLLWPICPKLNRCLNNKLWRSQIKVLPWKSRRNQWKEQQQKARSTQIPIENN